MKWKHELAIRYNLLVHVTVEYFKVQKTYTHSSAS